MHSQRDALDMCASPRHLPTCFAGICCLAVYYTTIRIRTGRLAPLLPAPLLVVSDSSPRCLRLVLPGQTPEQRLDRHAAPLISLCCSALSPRGAVMLLCAAALR